MPKEQRLGGAYLDIRAKNSQFVKQTGKTADAFKRLRAEARRVEKRNASLRRSFRNVGKSIQGFVVGSAVTLGLSTIGGGLNRLSREAAQAGADMVELGLRTRTSVEDLQGLERVFEADGLAAAKFSKALETLLRRSSEASVLASYEREFAALGISLQELEDNQGNALGLLRLLADGFGQTADQALKLRVAQQLMGREGTKLVPVLERGAEALEEQLAAFKGLGILTQQHAQDLKDLQQAFTDQENTLRVAQQKAIAEYTESIAELTGLYNDLKLAILNVGLALGDTFGILEKNAAKRLEESRAIFTQLESEQSSIINLPAIKTDAKVLLEVEPELSVDLASAAINLVQDEIKGINEDLDEAQKNLNDFRDSISNVTEIPVLGERLQINTKIDVQLNALDKLNAKYQELSSIDLDGGIQESLEKVNNQIGATADQIEFLQKKVDDFHGDLSVNETSLGTVDEEARRQTLKNLQESFQNLIAESKRLAEIDAVGPLEEQLRSLGSEITIVKNEISKLRDQASIPIDIETQERVATGAAESPELKAQRKILEELTDEQTKLNNLVSDLKDVQAQATAEIEATAEAERQLAIEAQKVADIEEAKKKAREEALRAARSRLTLEEKLVARNQELIAAEERRSQLIGLEGVERLKATALLDQQAFFSKELNRISEQTLILRRQLASASEIEAEAIRVKIAALANEESAVLSLAAANKTLNEEVSAAISSRFELQERDNASRATSGGAGQTEQQLLASIQRDQIPYAEQLTEIARERVKESERQLELVNLEGVALTQATARQELQLTVMRKRSELQKQIVKNESQQDFATGDSLKRLQLQEAEYRRQLEAIDAQIPALNAIIEQHVEILGVLEKNRLELENQANQTREIWGGVARDIGQAFGTFTRDALSSFDTVADAARALGRAITNALLEALVIQPLVKGLTAGLGGFFGLAEGGFSGTGFRLVGERGPELVDFRTPGRVYTNDELSGAISGGGNIELNFSPVIQTQDSSAIRQALAEAYPQFEQRTVDTIQNLMTRPSNLRRALG